MSANQWHIIGMKWGNQWDALCAPHQKLVFYLKIRFITLQTRNKPLPGFYERVEGHFGRAVFIWKMRYTQAYYG